MGVYSSQETFFNYNGWIMLYLCMGSVILCYILAANLTLFVEMPYTYLIKELSGRNKPQYAAGESFIPIEESADDDQPLLVENNHE